MTCATINTNRLITEIETFANIKKYTHRLIIIYIQQQGRLGDHGYIGNGKMKLLMDRLYNTKY